MSYSFLMSNTVPLKKIGKSEINNGTKLTFIHRKKYFLILSLS